MKGSEAWRLREEARVLRLVANTVWRQSEELMKQARDLNDAALAMEREYDRIVETAEDMAEVEELTGGKVCHIRPMAGSARGVPGTFSDFATYASASTANGSSEPGATGSTNSNGLLRFTTRGRTRQLSVVR